MFVCAETSTRLISFVQCVTRISLVVEIFQYVFLCLVLHLQLSTDSTSSNLAFPQPRQPTQLSFLRDLCHQHHIKLNLSTLLHLCSCHDVILRILRSPSSWHSLVLSPSPQSKPSTHHFSSSQTQLFNQPQVLARNRDWSQQQSVREGQYAELADPAASDVMQQEQHINFVYVIRVAGKVSADRFWLDPEYSLALFDDAAWWMKSTILDPFPTSDSLWISDSDLNAGWKDELHKALAMLEGLLVKAEKGDFQPKNRTSSATRHGIIASWDATSQSRNTYVDFINTSAPYPILPFIDSDRPVFSIIAYANARTQSSKGKGTVLLASHIKEVAAGLNSPSIPNMFERFA